MKIGDAFLSIMIGSAEIRLLRPCQQSNNSSDDEILLRRELSSGSSKEASSFFGIRPKKGRNGSRGSTPAKKVDDRFMNEVAGPNS